MAAPSPSADPTRRMPDWHVKGEPWRKRDMTLAQLELDLLSNDATGDIVLAAGSVIRRFLDGETLTRNTVIDIFPFAAPNEYR